MCGTFECEHVYYWNMYDDGHVVAWCEYADYDYLMCQVVRSGLDLQPDKGTPREEQVGGWCNHIIQ
jgi:hypothetical protein